MPHLTHRRPNEDAEIRRPRRGLRTVGFVTAVLGLLLTAAPAPAADPPAWGFESFTSRTTDAGEVDYTVAGGHPFQNLTRFDLFGQQDQLKDVGVNFPPGLFGNPAAAPRCPRGDISSGNCPPGSQVGFLGVNGGAATFPLYNVKPERGYPAQFVLGAGGILVSQNVTAGPRTESYGLTVGSNNTAAIGLTGMATTLCGYGGEVGGTGCKALPGPGEAPFLSNSVDCSDAQPTWKIAADSWEHSGRRILNGVPDLNGTPDLSDPNWKTATFPAAQMTECDALVFDPTIHAKPLQGGGPLQADQPAGLAIDVDFPQSNDPTDPDTNFDASLPQTPELKDIAVRLPAGLSFSPSSADGLGACSDLASDPAGDQVHYDNTKPVSCPDAAKIGTAVVTSPLLASHHPTTDAVDGAEPIGGDVYLLKPHPGDLPIGANHDGKFRILIQLENPRYGINFKLPGVAIADKQTGQITAVFTDTPQLPAKHLQISLKSGPRAPLATPSTCGRFDVTTDLVPWGTPTVPDATRSSDFDVSSGPNGSACVNSLGRRPFAPVLSAGTESSRAGAGTPFVMTLTRNDGEQGLSSLDLTTPKGFTAKLAGMAYCSDAAIASAAGKSGASEQANPSCPSASRIGTVTAGVGPGTNPYYATGRAYLAGPYKGGPLSFVFIIPAVVGPFDLGTIVVRNALSVNRETAQITIKTDPLPQIIDGMPLRLRSMTAEIDRDGFTLNPTNCEPMSIDATVGGANGATASASNAFQVGGCKDLGFKPDLKLSLKGDTGRSGHPALKMVLDYPRGNYANIAKAVVSLPHSEFLAPSHIRTICSKSQFAADQCPKSSIYGYVSATTPLLDQPLTGPLYMRSSSHPFPDFVAALRGQIDVDLVDRVDFKSGVIRTTFDAVPDAPISRFVLTMQGGRRGLLTNNRNLCKSVNKADVKFTAQNGRTAQLTPVLTNSCKKGKGKSGKSGRESHKRITAWLSSLGF